MTIHHNQILGVILAGGQSRRMNYEPKWQLVLQQQMIIEHVIQKLTPQVSTIIINGSDPQLKELQLPVISDCITGSQGPLAGILTGLEQAQQQGFKWLATCPCDCPFFPNHYVDKLSSSISTAQEPNITGAIIKSGGRNHGVFALWSVELASQLRCVLETTSTRAIGKWAQEYANIITVEMEAKNHDFFNINTPEDWEKAQRICTTHYHDKHK